MKYFKKLVGKKVYLSPINPTDYEQYCAWINDFNTTVCLGLATTNTSLNQEQKILEDLAQGHNYAIVKIADDKLIGNCSLNEINHINRTATLGIFIGEKDNRNQGLGTEAMELLLSYGFKVLNLSNIMLKVFAFNKRAINAYQKLGFNQFGRRTAAYFINDQYYDTIYMELLKKDFTSNILAEVFNSIIR